MQIGILGALFLAFSACSALAAEPVESTLLLSAGTPEISSEVVQRGGALLRVPVRHGQTAVLLEAIDEPSGFSNDRLEAGQYLYAVPMAGLLGGGTTWCAPRTRRSFGADIWYGACLLPTRSGTAWISSHDGLLIQALYFPGLPPVLPAPPKIRVGPAELGVEFAIEYRLIEWDRDDLDIRVYLDGAGALSRPIGDFSLPRQPDGSALLNVVGGTIRFQQVGTDRRMATVQIVAPMSADQAVSLPQPRRR